MANNVAWQMLHGKSGKGLWQIIVAWQMLHGKSGKGLWQIMLHGKCCMAN
jgi:hypothetical protein